MPAPVTVNLHRKKPAIEACLGSDRGLHRENNEDSYGHASNATGHVFVIADGMGGANAGEVASKMVVDKVLRDFAKGESLVSAIQRAHESIIRASRKTLSMRGMGSTVACLAVYPRKAAIVHVGDSRVYRVRPGEIELLTSDHSTRNHVRQTVPGLTEEQYRTYPKNFLARVVGGGGENEDASRPDSVVIDTLPGDTFVACSDGLTDMVEDGSIREIVLASKTCKEAVEQLVTAALRGGGNDNVTVIVVRVP